MKREAKKKQRSLNLEIIRPLETEAAETERRRRLNKALSELEKFAASVPPQGDNSPLIRAERER
jgi:hypothetical protein